MAGVAKESKWCDDAHAALCGALTNALAEAGSGPAKHKDSIMAFMASKNRSLPGKVFGEIGRAHV